MIIFEDKNIVVVNKPSGISTLPEADSPSLFDLLKKDRELFELNRIDKRVSGLVLFAKTKESQVIINKQFAESNVKKFYKAIVSKKPDTFTGILENYLEKNKNKSYISTPENKKAKYSKLSYELISSSERYHLLQIELFTGRFHQIRCQLANIGCPILGDLKYGYRRSSPDGSIFLHCFKLDFVHPGTQERVVFEIPCPEIWSKYGF
ncbi:MAG: RluA family pseudouridine synthase [Cytophagaceae bacterium]|nr:RluA family pseudouridine synthase [Cytophagaceae bacterium]